MKCVGCGGTVWSTDSRKQEGICEPCAEDIRRGNLRSGRA